MERAYKIHYMEFGTRRENWVIMHGENVAAAVTRFTEWETDINGYIATYNEKAIIRVECL